MFRQRNGYFVVESDADTAAGLMAGSPLRKPPESGELCQSCAMNFVGQPPEFQMLGFQVALYQEATHLSLVM